MIQGILNKKLKDLEKEEKKDKGHQELEGTLREIVNTQKQVIEAISVLDKEPVIIENKEVKFPQTQKVEEVKPIKEVEIKKPTWFSFIPIFNFFGKIFNKLPDIKWKVKLEKGNPDEPQFVVLVDKKGKSIDMKDLGGRKQGGGFGIFRRLIASQLVDADEEKINPATKEKQDSIISAINSIGGGATALTAGRKAVVVTNTAIVLGSAACKTIFINAFVSNSDIIVVGGSSVVYSPEGSRTGKVLYPGDSLTISIDNISKIYINGTANDGITFSFTT